MACCKKSPLPPTLQSCILGIILSLNKTSERLHRGPTAWSRIQLKEFHSNVGKMAVARARILSTWPNQAEFGNRSTRQKLFGGQLLSKFHWEQVAYVNLLEVRIG